MTNDTDTTSRLSALLRQAERARLVSEQLKAYQNLHTENTVTGIVNEINRFSNVKHDRSDEGHFFNLAFSCIEAGRQAKIASLTSELKDLLGVDIPKPTASTTTNESPHRQGSSQLPDPQFGEGLHS